METRNRPVIELGLPDVSCGLSAREVVATKPLHWSLKVCDKAVGASRSLNCCKPDNEGTTKWRMHVCTTPRTKFEASQALVYSMGAAAKIFRAFHHFLLLQRQHKGGVLGIQCCLRLPQAGGIWQETATAGDDSKRGTRMFDDHHSLRPRSLSEKEAMHLFIAWPEGRSASASFLPGC